MTTTTSHAVYDDVCTALVSIYCPAAAPGSYCHTVTYLPFGFIQHTI